MIRVLLADGSPLVRQELKRLLECDAEIAVIALAASARFALIKSEAQRPDVVVLADALADADAPAVRELRGLGVALVALDGETTATADAEREARLVARATELAPRIKTAARDAARRAAAAAPAPRPVAAPPTDVRVIAIGASTGGPQALHAILQALPADLPGLVIVQHMPDRFTAGFAENLDRGSRLHVAEAEDGDLVLPGTALVAPGDRHLELRRVGSELRVRLSSAPPVNHHRPSVDVLFRPVAAQVGRQALGVILTGMGADGAAGLLAMRQAGARTLAQDQASSVVFGMPKEAISAGAAERVVTLELMAREISAALGESRLRTAPSAGAATLAPSALPPGR